MRLRAIGGRSHSTTVDGIKYTVTEQVGEYPDRIGGILLKLFSKHLIQEPDIEPAFVLDEPEAVVEVIEKLPKTKRTVKRKAK